MLQRTFHCCSRVTVSCCTLTFQAGSYRVPPRLGVRKWQALGPGGAYKAEMCGKASSIDITPLQGECAAIVQALRDAPADIPLLFSCHSELLHTDIPSRVIQGATTTWREKMGGAWPRRRIYSRNVRKGQRRGQWETGKPADHQTLNSFLQKASEAAGMPDLLPPPPLSQSLAGWLHHQNPRSGPG